MKADTCTTEKEVHEMHDQMIISFTKRMRNVRNTRVYSKQVIRAIDYISEHHTPFMEEYLNFNDVLSEIFSKDGAEGAEDAKPVADEFLIESVYEGLLSAAEAMNLDEVEEILNELKDYAIPDSEKDKFDAIYKSVDNFDYDGIIAALKS
jgi:hypothetical protein